VAQRPFSQQAFGKYVLTDRIATGGMAEVYRAVLRGAAGFEKTVAIKRILPVFHDEAEFVALFQDEARIASTLSHANIAQVFDFGEVDGSYYLAMELVEGLDLAQLCLRLCKAGRTLPMAASVFVVAEAARGLAYAHDKRGPNGSLLGIVHRDVSPQNLLLSFAGEVKVVDFGIAKAAGKVHKTATGVRMGKLRYMSPEHVAGEAIDARADVFALGVILHELLTGEPIFPESATELAHAISATPIPPPSAKVAAIPAALDEIVLRALAKSREQRYGKASELSRDLAKFLGQHAPDFTREDLAALVGELARDAEVATRRDVSELALSPTIRSDPPGATSHTLPSDGHATPKARPTRRPDDAPGHAPQASPPRQLDQPTRTSMADQPSPVSAIPPEGARKPRASHEAKIGLALTFVIVASLALVGVRFALPGHEEASKAAFLPPLDAGEPPSITDSAIPSARDAAPTRTAFQLTPSAQGRRAELLGQADRHEIAHRGVLDARYALFLTVLDTQVATLVVGPTGNALEVPLPDDLARALSPHPDIAAATTAVMDFVRATGELPPRVKTALRVFLDHHPAVAPVSALPGYSAAALGVWLYPGDRERLADLAWANDTLGRYRPAPPPPSQHFAPVLCEPQALLRAMQDLMAGDPDAAALERWQSAVPMGQRVRVGKGTLVVRAARYEREGAGLRLLVWHDAQDPAARYALLGGGLAGNVSPSPVSDPDGHDAGTPGASLAFDVPRRFFAPVLWVGDETPILVRLPAPPLLALPGAN
jgi:serine/threonine protein kinase